MDIYSKLNFLEMLCGNDGHEGSKLVAFCIDKSCTFPNKFVCLDCIFQFHEQHKLIKLKQIQDKINSNLENEVSLAKDEQILEMKLKDTEESIKNEVEKIKTNILEIFNNKVNSFIAEVSERIMDYQKSTKNDSFDFSLLTKKEVRHLNKEEIEKLTTYLNLNFVQSQNQSISLSNPNDILQNSNVYPGSVSVDSPHNKKKTPLSELEKFNENFKKYIQDVNKTLCEFLNTKFLVTSSNILFSENLYFEWSDKTFGNYGMLYSITNNKLTSTKIQNDGTITILRSKDKLNLNENYYIEFYIDCKKFGDCEIGFGKDSVGPSCWLRTPGAYGITNVGVYENGKISKKEVRLEDGDILGFEIYLKNDKNPNFSRNCKFYKNSKLVHDCKIEIEEIYIMTAIRKVGNSITVKDFKTLN
jgi:hypothetical protein